MNKRGCLTGILGAALLLSCPVLVFAQSRSDCIEAALNSYEHPALEPTVGQPFNVRDERMETELKVAEDLYVVMGTGISYSKGSTKYHISEEAGILSQASELEFPLDNALWGLNVLLNSRDPASGLDRSRLSFSWQTSLDHDAGYMKDSDWLGDLFDLAYTGDVNPGKDIYSTSDATVDLNTVDLNYRAVFWPLKEISFEPMAGYRYEHFHYRMSNLHQRGQGSYSGMGWDSDADGPVLDYKLDYYIPYIGFGTGINLGGQARLDFAFGYSNWVSARDRDDHLLRSKLSVGKCGGSAFLFNTGLFVQIEPAWALRLSGALEDIDTTGMQYQSYYDGKPDTASIGDRIRAYTWSGNVGLEHRF